MRTVIGAPAASFDLADDRFDLFLNLLQVGVRIRKEGEQLAPERPELGHAGPFRGPLSALGLQKARWAQRRSGRD
jgi:hypothetical protein